MGRSVKKVGEYAALAVDSVLKELASSKGGLSERVAKSRLVQLGPNTISEKRRFGLLRDLLSHFTNPLILILLIAAGVSIFLGEQIDAVIICIVVLLGVLLDFFQEYNAGMALKRLKESVRTTATVLRDGHEREVKMSELCVGDVILLSAGDLIPADARIIESNHLFINQSSITGESYPVGKNERALSSANLAMTELKNIIFMGTSVVSGSARAVVIKTGKDTEFGRIATKLAGAPVKTDFEKGISDFSFLVMKITVFLVLFIFLFNSLAKHTIFESFLFAIAIAVGLTPELLPMIMSVAMARGSQIMSRKGVLVKKLNSIPNFGSMDILCTDKTGTLTENHIRLVTYTDISGKHSGKVLLSAYLNSTYQTGIRNPLDEAVLEFKKMDVSGFEKIAEIPYDFYRRRMSIVVSKGKERIMISKGAPEEMFNCCTHYVLDGRSFVFDDSAKKEAVDQYHKLSGKGYRVLAVASKKVDLKSKSYNKSDEHRFRFLGFVSFFDPPKHDVKNVLAELGELGIEIKVLTGDNELVTQNVCDSIGVTVKGVLRGQDIDKMTDAELKVKAEKTTIFARFSPDQKNRVMAALRANGHVVGFLGDGINDAPSLKTADVGISVNTGVDIAKESADIVLTHKSLHQLKEGVIEGRKTFSNTMKYIMMDIGSNFGNMFSAAGAILFLPFLPMLPMQILLNNLLYDFSQIAIPTDNVDKEWIQRPRKWNIDFIKKFMYVFGSLSSVFDFMTFFILYFIVNASAPHFQTGWFMESMATQILVIHIVRTKDLPFMKSTASVYVWLSSIVCLAVAWSIPYTSIGRFFKFEPLPWNLVLIIIGIVLVYLACAEMTKRIFYKKYSF